MKLISYLHNRKEYLGFIHQERIFCLRSINGKLPATMDAFLRDWHHYLPLAKEAERHIHAYPALQSTGFWMDEVQLLAPVPRPVSLQNGYVFRNHHAVTGPGNISCMPDHFEDLDFEWQAAAVICKKGKNIPADQADEYIGGLIIMNDFYTRKLQTHFASSLGPFLITADDLRSFEIPCKENHVGRSWNLPVSCLLNGRHLGDDNLGNMDRTFAEIIERASYGVDLYPGDIIIGGGAIPQDFCNRRIQPGDEITLCTEGLGELKNTVIKTDFNFSPGKQKKN